MALENWLDFDTLLVLCTSYTLYYIVLHCYMAWECLGALRSSQWICRATNSSQMEPGASRWRSDLSPTEICFALRCSTAESKLLRTNPNVSKHDKHVQTGTQMWKCYELR